MLCAYGVGAVVGNLVAGVAVDRIGPARVLATGYVVMATAMGVFAVLAATGTHVTVVVVVLAVAWGGASWCQTPAQQHRLMAAAPGEAPLVMALNASAIYVGIGVGTGVGGLMVASGVAGMFGVAAGVAVVALGWLGRTWRVGG
ncbi:MFS transporter [Catenulispora yoronensis]